MEASLAQHRGGSGAPVLLIHGIGSSWRAWLGVLDALEARHEVFALDLPGFGESAPLSERPTIAALAGAVEAEIAQHGLERPHIAGNSLGGWIALELARRGQARGVVALSPGGMWTPPEAAYARGALRATYLAVLRLAPYAEILTRSAAARTALFSLVSSRPWRIEPEQARAALEALAGADAFLETLEATLTTHAEELEEIDVPVVIAWGTRDRLLLPRQGPRAARRIPAAELVARTILELTPGDA